VPLAGKARTIYHSEHMSASFYFNTLRTAFVSLFWLLHCLSFAVRLLITTFVSAVFH